MRNGWISDPAQIVARLALKAHWTETWPGGTKAHFSVWKGEKMLRNQFHRCSAASNSRPYLGYFIFLFFFFCRGLKVGAREDAHRVECCSRRMRDLSADRSHVSRSRVLRALSAPYARPSTCPPFTRFPFHSFGEIGVDCGAFFWKFHWISIWKKVEIFYEFLSNNTPLDSLNLDARGLPATACEMNSEIFKLNWKTRLILVLSSSSLTTEIGYLTSSVDQLLESSSNFIRELNEWIIFFEDIFIHLILKFFSDQRFPARLRSSVGRWTAIPAVAGRNGSRTQLCVSGSQRRHVPDRRTGSSSRRRRQRRTCLQ